MSLRKLKKTKIGLIPEDWELKTIGSGCELITKGTTPASMSKQFIDGGINFLKAETISEEGNVIYRKISFIDKATYDLLKRSQLAEGDLLLTIAGVLGRVGMILPENLPANINQALAIIRLAESSGVDRNFLFYTLQSSLIQKQIEGINVQAAQANISLQNVRDFLIPLPPLPEQIEIARILGVWDVAIGDTTQLIAAKTQHKRGLMQQLLTGERRFAEFVQSGKRHQTPCGLMPCDWPSVKLKDVFNVVQHRNRGATERVLTASGQHGMVDQRSYFNRSVSGASIAEYYLLENGEFAYNRSSMKGYPFGAIKRLNAHDKGAVSTLYLCFALACSDCESDFWMHFFESGLLNGQLRSIAQMGARSHGLLNVTNSDFFAAVVPKPTLAEQRRIADVLDAATSEIELLQKQLDALKTQKRGLMQLLLSGEKPVTVASANHLNGVASIEEKRVL